MSSFGSESAMECSSEEIERQYEGGTALRTHWTQEVRSFQLLVHYLATETSSMGLLVREKCTVVFITASVSIGVGRSVNLYFSSK
jgi:hypothetical protein